jgi:probable HAF family extracellular repeat protein
MLSIVAFLAIAPMAADSPANAANFNFTQINVPGEVDTVATGINDAGQIVGYFSFTHGFLDTGGNFIQIDVPGAFFTRTLLHGSGRNPVESGTCKD